MRVAALYDIHANCDALDAVLAEVDDAQVDTIVVGGDFLAGPFPNETFARLCALGDRVQWLRGNCERELVEGTEEDLIARTPPLEEHTRAFIAQLPPTLTLDVDSLGSTLFCHATPRSDTEILTYRASEERIARALDGVEQRIVVCGHTHTQYERNVDDTRLVNAGSVGMAFEREPGAYWLLLGPDVEHRRTPYDVDAFLRRAADAGFDRWPRASPEEAATYFERVANEQR